MRPDWCPDLSGARVLIVASGPSAAQVPMEQAKGKSFVVAINESWRLCPWADMLYACDGTWWKKRNGVPEFTGLRVSQDDGAKQFSGYPTCAVPARRQSSGYGSR